MTRPASRRATADFSLLRWPLTKFRKLAQLCTSNVQSQHVETPGPPRERQTTGQQRGSCGAEVRHSACQALAHTSATATPCEYTHLTSTTCCLQAGAEAGQYAAGAAGPGGHDIRGVHVRGGAQASGGDAIATAAHGPVTKAISSAAAAASTAFSRTAGRICPGSAACSHALVRPAHSMQWLTPQLPHVCSYAVSSGSSKRSSWEPLLGSCS